MKAMIHHRFFYVENLWKTTFHRQDYPLTFVG